MTSVAIYSHEDRFSAHRNKADEAYQVGKGLTPVAAYLAQDDIIRVSQLSPSFAAFLFSLSRKKYIHMQLIS
jgi:pyruvate carboxylase